MLLQSHIQDGNSYVLQLLPALPAAWPDGEVKGLRARGGFKVDMQWKQGKLASLSIQSLLGSELKVSYKGKLLSTKTAKGKKYTFAVLTK
jgi:alpha-L-fucosidase 2